MTVRTDESRPPRPRGRGPSPTKTAQTRAAIVAVAHDLFLERGFAETRMADVTAGAGLAKGTLYRYFADKDALFDGVLRDAVGDPLGAAVAAAPGPEEGTRAYLERTVLPLLRDLERSRRAAVLRLVVAEGGRFPALAAAYRRQVLDPLLEAIRDLAQRARARGELGSDAITRFPLLLVAPGVVATVWNGLYGPEDAIDPAAAFAAFLDLVFPRHAREAPPVAVVPG